MRLGMAVVALTIVPAVLAAQTDSSRMRGADSTRRHSGRAQTSSGSIGQNGSSSSRGQRLTRDQVAQLQTALQQANCDPGAIDSVMGRRTRSAMSCARKQNNITGNNPNDLYRALNLDFANSNGANGSMQSDSANATNRANGASGTRGTRGARSSGTRGTGRMRGDSTGGRSTRSDSTRRPSTRRDTTRPGR